MSVPLNANDRRTMRPQAAALGGTAARKSSMFLVDGTKED